MPLFHNSTITEEAGKMNKIKFRASAWMLAILSFYVLAGSEVQGEVAKSSFAKPNVQALKALKASVGKPFSEGWVFIDGKYIEPPYKVERYGNVIRINKIQVTGEVIPWSEFIKTQDGVKVTKTTLDNGGGDAPAAEPESAVEEESEDDLWESSLDDLFDDEPSAKKQKKGAKKSAYKPRPKKPSVQVNYSFDGEFVENDKSKALKARIDAYRTKIDSLLRNGGYCCFSPRYAGITADGGAAKHLMEKLPDIMRTNANQDGFSQALRNAGFVYFPPALVNDLFRNRLDYLKLQKRFKEIKERAEWKKYMQN